MPQVKRMRRDAIESWESLLAHRTSIRSQQGVAGHSEADAQFPHCMFHLPQLCFGRGMADLWCQVRERAQAGGNAGATSL